MKRILCVLLVGVLMLTAFVGCEKQQSAHSGKEGVQLSLDQTSLTMGVYEKAVLTATVTNNAGEAVQQGITWTSANPAVAEVADGVVFAKGAGKTTITAKLADGTEASCSVESTYLGIVPQLVLVNAGGNISVATGQSFTLEMNVQYNGKDCTDPDTTYVFEVSDASVATVSDNGVITGVAEGTCELTVVADWRGLGGKNLDGGEDAYGLKQVLEITVVNP